MPARASKRKTSSASISRSRQSKRSSGTTTTDGPDSKKTRVDDSHGNPKTLRGSPPTLPPKMRPQIVCECEESRITKYKSYEKGKSRQQTKRTAAPQEALRQNTTSDEEIINETKNKLITLYKSSVTKIRSSREDMYRKYKMDLADLKTSLLAAYNKLPVATNADMRDVRRFREKVNTMQKQVEHTKKQIKENKESINGVNNVYKKALKSFEKQCIAYLQSKGV